MLRILRPRRKSSIFSFNRNSISQRSHPFNSISNSSILEMDKVGVVVRSESAKLTWCVAGVVSTLMIYGVLQERIMKFPYGEEKEYFKHSLFIVFCNRILSCIAAASILLFQKKPMAPVAPLYKYAGISLSNVIATTCQYEALKYVSFPLQTLAKSAKMLPVMIWGTIIMNKRYDCSDYLYAVFVTLGCSAFLMAGGSKKSLKVVNDTFWGISLMAGYLGFDGFTSTFQDQLFRGYSMDTYNQILYVTLCSCGISIFGLFSRGNFFEAINFVTKYPKCFFDILILSMSATVSQFFISYTIKTFGALIFATIMTTRQLLSIILSSILFGPPLSLFQSFGTVLVFGTLYIRALLNRKKKKKSESQSTLTSSISPKTETNPILESSKVMSSKDGRQEEHNAQIIHVTKLEEQIPLMMSQPGNK